MAAARQSLLSVGFSRQEHWSGLPCPPPGDLPSPGTEPTSLMSPAPAGEFFTIRATWNARMIFLTNRNKVPPSHTQVLEGPLLIRPGLIGHLLYFLSAGAADVPRHQSIDRLLSLAPSEVPCGSKAA